MNNFVLVGRIVSIKEIKGSKAIVKIAVNRSYKNNQGLYDTDFIDITLKGTIAKSTKQYCKKGDIVGIKGAMECLNSKLELVASKVSFLSTTHEDRKEC